LDFACAIGEDLARLALRLPGGHAWLGLSRVAGNAGQIAPVVAFPWTAGGAAGTAVLFANLHRVTGEASFADVARSALRLVDSTRARLAHDWWPRVVPSAYSGCAFPVYAFAECARLLDDEALFATAREFAL